MHSAHCICNFILANENLKTGFLAFFHALVILVVAINPARIAKY